MKKRVAVLASIGVVIIVVFGAFFISNAKAKEVNTFPENCYVNEVECSGMTANQAISKLTDKYNKKKFTLTKEGKTIGSLENTKLDFGFKNNIRKAITEANTWSMLVGFIKDTVKVDVKVDASKASKAFSRQIMNLPFVADGSSTKTANAYVDMEDPSFSIVPEVYGNNVDVDKLTKDIISKINNDEWTLEYTDEEYYVVPTIKKDDKELLQRQEYCKKYLSQKITYELPTGNYEVSAKELDKLITVDDNDQVSANKDGVKSFVRKIANKVNTLGRSHVFKSTKRGNITVNGGTYGFKINKKKEIVKLIKDLKEGKDVTRKPIYSSVGAYGNAGDIGNTYVEVDLLNQHLWYYKDGNLVEDADVVTGCITSDHQTVTGVYYIQYKARNVTLKGREDNGKKYESKVSYWMPFYYDYGLHDANWRGDFGGAIYVAGGSHGCVNMPPYSAQTLFENSATGCPVVIFR